MNTEDDYNRILVIDDNRAIHEAFRKILGADRAGDAALDAVESELFDVPSPDTPQLRFEIRSVCQGQEGVDLLQEAAAEGRPYTMAFVDVRMPPGMDGIETVVKMWETAPDLQVVICTAYSDYSWNDMIGRLGRSDRWVILKKPFEPVEVLQLANALTEKARLLHQAHVKEDELERRVQQRTSELTKLNADMADLVENLEVSKADLLRKGQELEASNKDLEGFSYSVSHDLKAPLRRVDGFAKMLEEDYAEKLDDKGRGLLRVVRDGAKDMGCLINDLLAFSRVSRKDLRLTRLDLPALVAEAKRLSEYDAAGRNIRWDIGELPPAFGDHTTIREVLVNLLSNAVKFTQPRPDAVITLEGRFEGDEVIYSVTDNGVGFNMDYKDKLFEVFQRLHAASEFEGTGIGLALVQRIIQRHGGRVWAEGKVDEGATFYFTLPREGEE
jgi:signal transduction histidine kinase